MQREMVAGADGEWIYFDMVPQEHEVRSGAAEYTGKNLCDRFQAGRRQAGSIIWTEKIETTDRRENNE